MKFVLSTLLFLFVIPAFSQDSTYVQVLIKNKKEGETIQNVSVTISIDTFSVTRKTNMKGYTIFRLPIGKSGTVDLKHNAFIAEKESIRIPGRSTYDTLQYTYYMESIRVQDYDDIVVKAPGVPDTVFSSRRLHVSDFEIDNNGDVLMLVYPKRLKKGSQLVLFDGINIKSSFEVPDVAEELVRDYRGNPHVVCANNVFGIHATREKIGVSTLSKDYYMTYLAPILDTNKTKLYFSNFNPDYPAFEYFSYDQLDSSYRKIMHIEDDLMMELYRSEYKWVDVRTKLWALNKELQTGIDAEIWVGANYFTQSIYYKELYAPLFHRNDSLFVFDYYKDKLYTYDAKGEALDSVEIYHHYNPKRTGWKKQLIQDRKTGEIYAVFDRAGYSYIGRVDTKTGEISQQVKLEFRYIDKIAIHNNFVYYIYREFESIDKRSLYKERLPYNFKEAKVLDGDKVEKSLSDR